MMLPKSHTADVFRKSETVRQNSVCGYWPCTLGIRIMWLPSCCSGDILQNQSQLLNNESTGVINSNILLSESHDL